MMDNGEYEVYQDEDQRQGTMTREDKGRQQRQTRKNGKYEEDEDEGQCLRDNGEYEVYQDEGQRRRTMTKTAGSRTVFISL